MPDNTTPVGQTFLTTRVNAGINALDRNTNARGAKAAGTLSEVGLWRKMEQTCPVIAMGRRSLVGVLQGVQFDVQAHEDCPEDVVELVRSALFERPKKQFSEYAENIFSAVPNGFGPQEITFKHEDGKIYLADLGYRPPNTIDTNTVEVLPSGWVKCKQRFYKETGMPGIVEYGEPGQDGVGILLWPVFGNSNGPLGEGYYRPLYSIYEEWCDAVRIRHIATQRASLGVFTFQAKEGIKVDSAQITAAQQAIAEASTHQVNSLFVPPWVELSKDKSGWVFSNPNAIKAITDVINDCETRMMQCFGNQYAARGITSEHGSFASSKVDQEEMGGHRQAHVDWLSRQIQPLIDLLVIMNYGEQKHYPQLVGSVPHELSPAELVASMVSATSANLLVVDSGVRGSVRAALKQEPEGDEVAESMSGGKQGGPLLSMAGGVSSYLEVMQALADGSLTRESAVAAVMAFYQLDKKGAEDLVQIDEERAAQKQEQAEALRQAVINTAGDESDGLNDDAKPDDKAPDGSTGKQDGKAEMVAAPCSCDSYEFVRAAPRRGGYDQRTGPRGRDLSVLERQVNWRKIEFTLDNGTQSLHGVLMDARYAVAAHLLASVKDGSWQTPAELAGAVRSVKVPASMQRRIEREIGAELYRVAQAAAESVDSERAQQGDALEFAAAAAAAWDGGDGFGKESALSAAQEAINDARTQLVTASLSISAPTLAETFALLERAASQLSEMQASATATLVTTEAFARARLDRAREIAQENDKPKNVWYSAILDANTCDACFEADQAHGQMTGSALAFDTDEMSTYMPPYQRCKGGARCRCQLIFEW